LTDYKLTTDDYRLTDYKLTTDYNLNITLNHTDFEPALNFT